MKRLLGTVLAVCLSVFAVGINAAGAMWVSGFYVGWTASSYPPSAIDFSSLTHVMVFSVLPHADGTLDTALFIDAVNGPLVAQDVARRAHAAGKKAILTVGGAGTGTAFAGATGSNMTMFVQNLAQTVTNWGFDGVDIDWEPLSSANYSAMLALISQLRTAKPGIIVTADVGWQNINFPLSTSDALFYSQLAQAVDQMNVMTYSMADNWGGWVVWHSSALYGEGGNHPSSVSSTARMYVNAGVPAAKLGLGIGFYGSCWNAPATAPLQSPGSSHVVGSDNTFGFANIMNLYYSPFNYRYDSVAEAPYLTFASPSGPSGCTFISYEDETSVAAKANYARQAGLGGTIIWQLNEGYNPSAADSSSLLHAVGHAFLGTTSTVVITALAGTPQSAPEGTAFSSPLRVQARDTAGTPLAGVVVTFAAPVSDATATFGGSVSTSVLTDATGVATAAATASRHYGGYEVTANADGAASLATFSLTNTLVGPFSAQVIGGSPQSTMISHTFSQALRMVVRDAYGNGVSGVAIIFQTPTSGPSALVGGSTTTTVVTDATGTAAVTATANGQAGSYTVVAGTKNFPAAVTFSLTNTPKKGRLR
jgi:chitinase